MDQTAAVRFQKPSPQAALGLGLLVLGLMGAAGAAFYGWIHHGSAILLSLQENGLSWCL